MKSKFSIFTELSLLNEGRNLLRDWRIYLSH